MKTGEILITIHRKDVKTIVKDLLGLQHNQLSPFSEAIDQFDHPVATHESLVEISGNPDAVKCLKIIAMPECLINIRLGGPAVDYTDMILCKSKEDTCVLLISQADTFNILYSDNKEDLKGFIISAISGKFEKVTDAVIPEKLSIEMLVLLANIIDSYRFAGYRDALLHKDLTIPKITLAEFNDLLKASMSQVDFRWLLSNMRMLLPELMSLYQAGGEENYNFLFDGGFLLSGKDDKTGEDYLLLNMNSVDLGAEFLHTWHRSAGVSLTYLENGAVRSQPEFIVFSTAAADHSFRYDNAGENLQYRMLTQTHAAELVAGVLSKADRVANRDNVNKVKFCVHCGSKLEPGVKFCGKCGNKTLD